METECKCLVNKCLLGHAETMEQCKLILGSAEFPLPNLAHILFRYL